MTIRVGDVYLGTSYKYKVTAVNGDFISYDMSAIYDGHFVYSNSHNQFKRAVKVGTIRKCKHTILRNLLEKHI